MTKIGITGGLASGKTTASLFLQEKGCPVFDADKEAKDILFNSPDLWEKLAQEFGPEIITEKGLDKIKLAKAAFSSRSNQSILNSLIHPRVRNRFQDFVAKKKAKNQIVVADVPLLFESDFEKLVDYSLLIFTDRHVRIKRALERGNLTRKQIEKRIELQMPEEEKKKLASYVIENNGSLKKLRKKVDHLYEKIVNKSIEK
ncbi:MAG TPA: dephospho-CoA kinase [bacterium]|nr:dephospho-CoA kinase [bacterium]